MPVSHPVLPLLRASTTALILWTAFAFLGRLEWRLELLSHFRIQLAVALVGCSVLAAWVRARHLVVAAAVGAAVNLFVVSPQLVQWPTATARIDRPAIRVVHANVNRKNRDVETALRYFRRSRPDVLVIVESNPFWASILSNLKDELPFSLHTHKRYFGVSVLSRYPMKAREIYFDSWHPSVLAEIATPHGPLAVLGTHPSSPMSSRRSATRNRHLRNAASVAELSDVPLVLVGDLNTTPWSHAFQDLLDVSGLRDTSRGAGLQRSWRHEAWKLALPLDHALISSDVTLIGRALGPSIGSDHRPLVVDIALAPRARTTTVE